MRRVSVFAGALALAFLSASAVDAQATRTWVSGVGDDANPCSRTAPCKTFPGAISKTAAGGIINVMDPGTYGAVTITKAITIQNEGAFAGVLFSVGSGIIVNAGPTDSVILRGLSFEGAGLGTNGIRFLNGLALYVERCEFNRGTEKGIDFEPAGNSLLFVKDTVIRNFNFGAGGAILVKPGSTGSANVFLDNVQLERSVYGLRAEDRSNVTVVNSQAVRNSNEGFFAISTAGGTVTMNLERAVSTFNLGAGVRAQGTAATARISNMLIAGNASGIVSTSSGAIVSVGNNSNFDNGNPTSTIMPQ